MRPPRNKAELEALKRRVVHQFVDVKDSHEMLLKNYLKNNVPSDWHLMGRQMPRGTLRKRTTLYLEEEMLGALQALGSNWQAEVRRILGSYLHMQQLGITSGIGDDFKKMMFKGEVATAFTEFLRLTREFETAKEEEAAG